MHKMQWSAILYQQRYAIRVVCYKHTVVSYAPLYIRLQNLATFWATIFDIFFLNEPSLLYSSSEIKRNRMLVHNITMALI